ncbi:hypothetical protein M6B38_212995 [Iris pallida]|uniref:Uncharacterized protein n=1 Tax=Iris pallida TaxID=29817 RepID=A0AAX6E1U4_IRIPA|nr:hypothetical protein M6B38_212995 [Iris pallida]
MDGAAIFSCLCNIAYTNKYFQFGMNFISTFDLILSSPSYNLTTVHLPANSHSNFWHDPLMLIAKVRDIEYWIHTGWVVFKLETEYRKIYQTYWEINLMDV